MNHVIKRLSFEVESPKEVLNSGPWQVQRLRNFSYVPYRLIKVVKRAVPQADDAKFLFFIEPSLLLFSDDCLHELVFLGLTERHCPATMLLNASLCELGTLQKGTSLWYRPSLL